MKTFEEYLANENISAQDARRRANLPIEKIGQGIFDMDFVSLISAQKNIETAKKMATNRIEDSSAREENKDKARIMVNGARNTERLATGMSNFILSNMGLKSL